MGKDEFLRFATDHGFSLNDINMVVADIENEAFNGNPPDWEYGKALLFYNSRIAHYKMSKEEFLTSAGELGYTEQQIQKIVETVERNQRKYGDLPAWETQLTPLPVQVQ